jgi:hypothetical protein
MSAEEDIAERQHWLQSLEVGSSVALYINGMYRIETVSIATERTITMTNLYKYSRRDGSRVTAFPQPIIEPVTEDVINAIKHEELVRQALDLIVNMNDIRHLRTFSETELTELIRDLEKYRTNEE